jgi:hypothetical protein
MEGSEKGTTRLTALAPHGFGGPSGPDPVEVGRRGGIASGVSRRLREQRELEAKILASKNGAAIGELLEIRLERERDLERERFRLDQTVCKLLDEADVERGSSLDCVSRWPSSSGRSTSASGRSRSSSARDGAPPGRREWRGHGRTAP